MHLCKYLEQCAAAQLVGWCVPRPESCAPSPHRAMLSPHLLKRCQQTQHRLSLSAQRVRICTRLAYARTIVIHINEPLP